MRVNYRLSKKQRYPTPIHDVLAGYDWIVSNLARGIPSNVERTGPANLAVCGELIGGSLAAALALTECSTSKVGIRAVVMGNPVSDWTAMHQIKRPSPQVAAGDEVSPPKKKRAVQLPSWEVHGSSGVLPAASFLKARGELFRLPEDYFDPFASPTLFFRTPSSALQAVIDPLDELFLDIDISPEHAMKKRRSYRRYPHQNANLQLPDARFLIGEQCALKDQSIDLAEGMARSNHLYGGLSGTGEGTGWERVEVDLKDEVGLWAEHDLVDIGAWFGEKLRHS